MDAKKRPANRFQVRLVQTLSLLVLLGLTGAGLKTLRSYPVHIPNIQPSISNPQLYLRAITVKILADKQAIGSGVINSQQDGWYTVITNHHVLRSHPQPWQIQTADQKIYIAQVITPSAWTGLDLALLKFQAVNVNYPIAKINPKFRLQVGETVIAGGFPLKPSSELQSDLQGFVSNSGYVTHLLTKPLIEGYQIGYTNLIYKGMSGGPLLNNQGELVGINGIHDQPLWSMPEMFADGTAVPEPLQSQIGNFSWAIPARIILNN